MSTDGAPTPVSNEQIETWVGRVDANWRRQGVSAHQRRLLAGDLQRDLDEALSNGASVADLVQPDPVAFATEVARAQGIDLTQARPVPEVTIGNVIVTSVAGGVIGALLTWFVIFPIGLTAMPTMSDLFLVLSLYGSAALVTLACVVGALVWRFRGTNLPSSLVVAVSSGFALGGLASVPVVIGFARTTNYSDAPLVVLIEASIAAGFCSLGIAGALGIRRRVNKETDPTRRSEA